MIIVLAKLIPKEGKDDEIINAALNLVGETRKEDANIEYNFDKDIEDDTYLFIEKWEDINGLNNHIASDHFKNFNKVIEPLSEDMDIKVFNSEPFNLYE
jgi:quinol monooxygenase YgiN